MEKKMQGGIKEVDRKDLEPQLNQIISQPLNDHVALSWGQRFLIDTNYQSLSSFFNSDPTSTLHNIMCKLMQPSKLNRTDILPVHVTLTRNN